MTADMENGAWTWAGEFAGVGVTYVSREVAEENIAQWESLYPGREFRVAPCTSTDPYFVGRGRWIVEYR